MEAEEYERIAVAEDGHWWYQAVRQRVAAELGPVPATAVVLDVGCGPGGNGAVVAGEATLIGVDPSAVATELAATRHPQARVVRGSGAQLPIASGTCDVVLVLTVLYTVPDPAALLGEVARVLRPGGRAVLVEPADPKLWRGHDDVVHGRRRFERGELESSVEAAGLVVSRSTRLFSFLVAPARLLALVDRTRRGDRPRSDLERPAGARLARLATSLEGRWTSRRDLRFGTSVLVSALAPSEAAGGGPGDRRATGSIPG